MHVCTYALNKDKPILKKYTVLQALRVLPILNTYHGIFVRIIYANQNDTLLLYLFAVYFEYVSWHFIPIIYTYQDKTLLL